MRLLLDSHVLLWAAADAPKLSKRAREANEAWLSHASVWELTIKIGAGRLRIDRPLAAMVADLGIRLLPISLGRIEATARLPPHHGDPFDRMLADQAVAEGLTLVTADTRLQQYPVSWLW